MEQFNIHDLPIEALCAGLPYPLEYLKGRQNRITWEDFCLLIQNARRFWSDGDFIALGFEVTRSSPFRGSLVVARYLFQGPELYLWLSDNIAGPGKQLFSCVAARTTRIDRNRFITSLNLPPGYSYCREFFLITKGALSAASTMIGLDAAQVKMTETEHGATFDIHCPDGTRFFTKIRRVIAWPFQARGTAQELKEANEALLKRYNELEETQEEVKRQAAQLQAAYEISQILRSTLDLDSTLEAICRSLVNVARFDAAEVTVKTFVEGEPVERTSRSGTTGTSVPSLTRPMEIHGETMGQLSLWLAPGCTLREADELLAYILPTISMAVRDALSVKLITDYRNSLEAKVAARTRELRQINEELKEAQAGRDRLFSAISHEFRTPLTLILGPLEKLLGTTFAEKDREWLHLIRRNANTLLDLINELLDLSKLQSGKMRLAARKRDIIPFFKGIVMSYQSLAEAKGISVAVVTEVERLDVYVDTEKAERILNNLLSNALKFTSAGGSVRVNIKQNVTPPEGAERAPNVVEISVRDTGIGIPESDIPRIFDRFYQVDGSSTRARGGTGIGLALAKELVELHHGSIRVRSVYGKGSEFTVTLPLGRNHLSQDEIADGEESAEVWPGLQLIIDDEQRTLSSPPASIPQQMSSALILIVEDNADVRAYIRESLPKSYNIIEADDGEDGLNRAQETIPDMIISDVMMPKRDGYDLCRTLKNDEKTSHIPIILLTAKAASENKIEGLETGADDYLIKPFEPNELLVRVRNLIEQRRKLRERFKASVPLKPGEIAVTSVDDAFLIKVMAAVEQHLGNEHFHIEELSTVVGMSRVQLHRKLTALTNQGPGEFIRYIRLHRALELLQKDAGTISEIAYKVGFSDPSYFSKCFQKQFGKTPTDVKKSSVRPEYSRKTTRNLS